jgi:hypothetical protein
MERMSEGHAIDRVICKLLFKFPSKIAHGELTPPSPNECLDKAHAFTAIHDFLHRGERPGWLSYKYVP